MALKPDRMSVSKSCRLSVRTTGTGVLALVALCAPAIVARADVASSSGATVVGAAASAPHSVPPTVIDLAVPTVAPKDRRAMTEQLGEASLGSASLVAHLRKRLDRQFSLVGVTWESGTATKGTTVSVRSRSLGAWSDWTALDIDPEEGPAASEETATRDGTAPAWVGQATGVEVAVFAPDGSPPAGLTVDAIDPGMSSYDAMATATTSSRAVSRSRARAGAFPSLPDVVTRDEWGADPSLVDPCDAPRIGTTFKMVFVHHTAGSNNYSRVESASVVRGVYAYHTQSRGWCDIGYNFLVDRYGKIYEGRRGGMRLPVRGAHSGDYNVDTTGISLMGDFTSVNPTRKMKLSLVDLIVWRMGAAYHGGYGRTSVNGSTFSRVSGHRDAMSTSCPGQRVYDRLPGLRSRVAARLAGFESPIETRWRAMGGASSELGPVHVGEQVENHGHHTTFQKGRMYTQRGGLYKLYRGPVLHAYIRHGENDGALGYPRSNQRTIAHGAGLSAVFARGRIFWSQATDSTLLHNGPILSRYLDAGSAGGRLGFPVSPARSTKTGTIARFQHGTISYDASSHRTKVRYS
ncbi:MAG TPA: N-acetylmuramoyl-L-alanine amidase [Pseudonocardiaceae bacterium]|nr:N-acetylmuramoyl-L-alanine amidase [Pseudonocardiaceae bacterium]